MADNKKESKGSIPKETQTRGIFKDAMVEGLIEALEASKIDYDGREVLRGVCAEKRRSNSLFYYCILISSAVFNIKNHNETDSKSEKQKLPACSL